MPISSYQARAGVGPFDPDPANLSYWGWLEGPEISEGFDLDALFLYRDMGDWGITLDDGVFYVSTIGDIEELPNPTINTPSNATNIKVYQVSGLQMEVGVVDTYDVPEVYFDACRLWASDELGLQLCLNASQSTPGLFTAGI